MEGADDKEHWNALLVWEERSSSTVLKPPNMKWAGNQGCVAGIPQSFCRAQEHNRVLSGTRKKSCQLFLAQHCYLSVHDRGIKVTLLAEKGEIRTQRFNWPNFSHSSGISSSFSFCSSFSYSYNSWMQILCSQSELLFSLFNEWG